MYKWLKLIFLIWCAAGVGFAARESPLNVDVFFGWDGCYKPMEWMPVEINISSTLKEPFAGSIVLSGQQDGLNRLSVAHEFVLTPQMPLYVPLSTKLTYAAENCSVQITDGKGRPFWSNDFMLWDYSQDKRGLTAVSEGDLLIGLVGRGKFGLVMLPDKTATYSSEGIGEVYLKDKLPRAMPWDWTGYVCLDALILYDLQWDSIRAEQWKAVTEWVSNGGRLMVILGSNPMPADCPLLKMLPLDIAQQQQIAVDAALYKMGNEAVVPAWPIRLRPDAVMWNIEANSSGEGILAWGWTGFGKVAVLGFDPDLLADAFKKEPEKLWVGWLKTILEQPMEDTIDSTKKVVEENTYDSFQGNPPGMMSRKLVCKADMPKAEEPDSNAQYRRSYNYRVDPGLSAANRVMEFLYDIPQMRPLSVWWVVLLLVLLAVLLGPVDYLVLKKMDKLPWTWVTCAGWIILFSAGSYWGVQALRAGDMQVRAVSVMDGCSGGVSWNTGYCGMFSPGSESYVPTKLKQKQWWSAVAPSQDYMYSYSRQKALRTVYCSQHDGGNLPYSVPVHIWTMQCLLVEEPIAALPMEATVSQTGQEIKVVIENRGLQPLLRGNVLLKDGKMFSFDRVDAGTTCEFNGLIKDGVSWLSQERFDWTVNPYNYSSQGNRRPDYLAAVCWAQGARQRSEAMVAYLQSGKAAVVCAEYEQPPIPLGLKDRTFGQNHLQYVRQVTRITMDNGR
ncbi:MAG: hypothetical protein ABFD91_17910 [Anaerohalosphaeraceae bacterium]